MTIKWLLILTNKKDWTFYITCEKNISVQDFTEHFIFAFSMFCIFSSRNTVARYNYPMYTLLKKRLVV